MSLHGIGIDLGAWAEIVDRQSNIPGSLPTSVPIELQRAYAEAGDKLDKAIKRLATEGLDPQQTLSTINSINQTLPIYNATRAAVLDTALAAGVSGIDEVFASDGYAQLDGEEFISLSGQYIAEYIKENPDTTLSAQTINNLNRIGQGFSTSPTAPSGENALGRPCGEANGVVMSSSGGGSYYFKLLPAQQYNVPMQGSSDPPNAMPGLHYRIIPNIARMKIPGYAPVFQHLGIDSVLITMVGTFIGDEKLIRSGPAGSLPYTEGLQYPTTQLQELSDGERLKTLTTNLDSYKSATEFYRWAVVEGRELDVNIRMNLFQEAGRGEDNSKLRDNSSRNPKFKGIIRSMELYYSRHDRTWYTIQMEVTDFGMYSNTPLQLSSATDSSVAELEESVAEESSVAGSSAIGGTTDPVKETLNDALTNIQSNGNYNNIQIVTAERTYTGSSFITYPNTVSLDNNVIFLDDIQSITATGFDESSINSVEQVATTTIGLAGALVLGAGITLVTGGLGLVPAAALGVGGGLLGGFGLTERSRDRAGKIRYEWTRTSP